MITLIILQVFFRDNMGVKKPETEMEQSWVGASNCKKFQKLKKVFIFFHGLWSVFVIYYIVTEF